MPVVTCPYKTWLLPSILVGLILSGAVLGACATSFDGNERSAMDKDVPGGDAEQGRVAIQEYGCGACHTIDGVAGANGRLAPPLSDLEEQELIAGGVVPNTPERLILWIQDPQQLKSDTTMPNMGVTTAEARDIAAYLYSGE